MSKYYVVKNGRNPGIYKSWESCLKQVSGFSGAVYKSFLSAEDAERYYKDNTEESIESRGNHAVVYTDGSYNIHTGDFSCGVIILFNDDITKISYNYHNNEMASMRNVAGEIMGVKNAVQYCIDNDIKYADIYYDYTGIEYWADGSWKTNNKWTKEYKNFIQENKTMLHIKFHKVKAHSADKYNDMADMLAKKAVGII
jgi:viroplasmin and RNaseH domain-containing protein